MSTNSKYTRNDRKNIVDIIEKLKNNNDYVEIFKILTDDPSNSYSYNSNGVFLNLSVVNDDTLDKICKYLKSCSKKRQSQQNDTTIYPLESYTKHTRLHKLTNYEKNIIKQQNLRSNQTKSNNKKRQNTN